MGYISEKFDRNIEILRMRKNGSSLREIAETFELATGTVYDLIRRHTTPALAVSFLPIEEQLKLGVKCQSMTKK